MNESHPVSSIRLRMSRVLIMLSPKEGLVCRVPQKRTPQDREMRCA